MAASFGLQVGHLDLEGADDSSEAIAGCLEIPLFLETLSPRVGPGLGLLVVGGGVVGLHEGLGVGDEG